MKFGTSKGQRYFEPDDRPSKGQVDNALSADFIGRAR